MESDFEQLMNEKMDNASLDDVLPEFDKAAAWSELEHRIGVKRKKSAVWTHAAAVILGIIAGGITLNLLLPGNTDMTPMVVVQQHTDTIIKQQTDTLFIVKENSTYPPSTTRRNPATTARQPQTTIASEEEPALQTDLKTKEEPVEEVATTVTLPKKVVEKIKPVHLLDIDNEDREAALYHNDPNAPQRTSFVLQISAQRNPPDNNQQQSSFINELFKK